MKRTTPRVRRPRSAASAAAHGPRPGRRAFLTSGTGLGLAALGVPPWIAGCGGSDDAGPAPAPAPPLPARRFEQTLFVDLSHEDHPGRAYTLTAGGRRYRLTPVAEAPEVLRQARAENAFLRAVPDRHITHHVANAVFAADSVTLGYVSVDLDARAGTWAMSSTQLIVPPTAAARAYAGARARTPAGALPMSAKRAFYGAPAARSEQDLRDERVLLDPMSHAATVICCHPDLFSLEPGAAHVVLANHVDTGIDAFNLATRLSAAGPATPEQAPGKDNPAGWGTLTPVVGDDGRPMRIQNGQHAGRIQFLPSLRADLHALARSGMNAAIPAVRDDPSLGADVTGIVPGEAANARLAGSLWMRHDGLTRIDQGSGAGDRAADMTMTLKQQNPQALYLVNASSSLDGKIVKAALTFTNFYLEFRGIYVQFLDGEKVLKLSDIPEYAAGTIVPLHSKVQDTDTAMFFGLVGPVYTVLGIPTIPGFTQPKFNVPAGATSVRILSSGLSFQGGNAYSQTVLPGAIMTGVFNYGVTILLAALGAAGAIGSLWRTVVIPFAQTLALELIATITNALSPNNGAGLIGLMLTPAFWIGQALVVAKMLLNTGVGAATTALVKWIVAQVTLLAVEEAIPLVGQIMQGISIAVGAINVAETTGELATTPWTFVDELVFTHDLTVTLLPDLKVDKDFPAAATGYTVTAMFDDGTPHEKDFVLDGSARSTLPPVVFTAVPLGGNVNVSVAFVEEATFPGMPGILLGKGSSGLVANVAGAAPSITIEELAFPIGPDTRYRHVRKTTLDADGRHGWTPGPAPTLNAAVSKCGDPGAVCPRSIAVRQATGSAPGFVGYSWQSQNHDPGRAPSCRGGGQGQLDQLATLGTDPASAGRAPIAYASSACGIDAPGVQVAYSLIGSGAQNFYLDTSDPTTPTIRQVTLDPAPSIGSPLSGQAWGVLNYASDTLLLHPAGHIVSVSAANHRFETLQLPRAALPDRDAKVQLLAQVKSGKGSRPGRIDMPAAMAISADGVILVLEVGNNRIQAFDLGGNPVRHFTKQAGPNASPYSLTLGGTDPVAGWQYLDLAVEFTGYLYVLSYNQNTFAYRLDLYHPQQADTRPIATTPDVNAARLAVDLWRNVYTLNYEVLQLPGGAPAGLTEPSVSFWTPCATGRTC